MLKTKHRMSQIFVPGGFPQITYIPRTSHQLEARVRAAADYLCKLVVVTGATKSGKTVLVDKIFPTTSTIWINGGTISDEQSFWDSITESLSLFTSFEESSGNDYGGSLDGEAAAEGNVLLAKGSAKVGASVHGTVSSANTKTRNVSSKIIAIKALTEQCIPLIVDDFHYIDKPIQKAIVRALKAPIMHGLPVVFIAIPNRKYDAVEVEREMTGRIDNIEMPVWSIEELSEIAYTGFHALNVLPTNTMVHTFANAAYGSPFLMQEFCKEICTRFEIFEECSELFTMPDVFSAADIFSNIAEHSGRSMFEKLKRGPRARTDRKPRLLKNGNTTDIYGVVMEAFKTLQPGVQSISYDSLRTSIRSVLSEEPHQKHDISRVLDKIAEISYTDSSSTPVIDWQSDDDVLTVTDPFFAFFLKWSR